MEIINAIAVVLGIEENQIKSFETWEKVFFIKFNIGRPTFVSKRKVHALLPMSWKLTVGRRSTKAWVAKLVGICPTYAFQREWLEGEVIVWGKKKAEKMKFLISEPGLYHDSDDDYFLVGQKEGRLDFIRCMCRGEAEQMLKKSLKGEVMFA